MKIYENKYIFLINYKQKNLKFILTFLIVLILSNIILKKIISEKIYSNLYAYRNFIQKFRSTLIVILSRNLDLDIIMISCTFIDYYN